MGIRKFCTLLQRIEVGIGAFAQKQQWCGDEDTQTDLASSPRLCLWCLAGIKCIYVKFHPERERMVHSQSIFLDVSPGRCDACLSLIGHILVWLTRLKIRLWGRGLMWLGNLAIVVLQMKEVVLKIKITNELLKVQKSLRIPSKIFFFSLEYLRGGKV